MTNSIHGDSSKARYVRRLFDYVAHRYDFLNHLFSFGADLFWRRKTALVARQFSPGSVLDLCCGTGDLTCALAKHLPSSSSIHALDFSENMLHRARRKFSRKNLHGSISLIQTDCMALPFGDNTFDLCTIAFGLRNFDSPEQGLMEMRRVTKHGGKIVILEFDLPANRVVRFVYLKYFLYVIPFIARIVLGKTEDFPDNPYRYFTGSVIDFAGRKKIDSLFEHCAIANTKTILNSFGISAIYIGEVKK